MQVKWLGWHIVKSSVDSAMIIGGRGLGHPGQPRVLSQLHSESFNWGRKVWTRQRKHSISILLNILFHLFASLRPLGLTCQTISGSFLPQWIISLPYSLKKNYRLIWLCWVLVLALQGLRSLFWHAGSFFSWGIRDVVTQPGIESEPPALGVGVKATGPPGKSPEIFLQF